MSKGQHEIEFAFFIGTFWLALEIGNFVLFFFEETEYGSREDSDLGTKFNC